MATAADASADALPRRLVDYFAIVGLEDDRVPQIEPGVAVEADLLFRYPSNHDDFELDEAMVRYLCFPADLVVARSSLGSQHHMFVMTKMDGASVYGYCLTLSEPTAAEQEEDKVYVPKVLCFISHYMLQAPFRLLLEQLDRFSRDHDSLLLPIECVISQILHDLPTPVPGGRPVEFALYELMPITFRLPDQKVLEPMRVHVRRLLSLLHVDNVLLVLNCILLELKIVLVATRQHDLTNAAEVLKQLIFPLKWPYVYIPCLPLRLMDVLDAPQPYIVGLPLQPGEECPELPSDAVIVDLEYNEVFLPNEERFPELPQMAAAKLRSSLHQCVRDGDKLADPQVSRAVQSTFLAFFSDILGECEKHVMAHSPSSFDGDGDDCNHPSANFQLEEFLASVPAEERRFYAKFMVGQTFANYLDEKSLHRSPASVIFETARQSVKAGGVLAAVAENLDEDAITIPRPAGAHLLQPIDALDASRLVRFPVLRVEDIPNSARSSGHFHASPLPLSGPSSRRSSMSHVPLQLLRATNPAAADQEREALLGRYKRACSDLIVFGGHVPHPSLPLTPSASSSSLGSSASYGSLPRHGSLPRPSSALAPEHALALAAKSDRLGAQLCSALEQIFAHGYRPPADARTSLAGAMWQVLSLFAKSKAEEVADLVFVAGLPGFENNGVLLGRAFVYLALEKESLHSVLAYVLDEKCSVWSQLYSSTAFLLNKDKRDAVIAASIGLLGVHVPGLFATRTGFNKHGKEHKRTMSVTPSISALRQFTLDRYVSFSSGSRHTGHTSPVTTTFTKPPMLRTGSSRAPPLVRADTPIRMSPNPPQ